MATRGLEAPGAVIQRGSEAKEDLIGWMQDMTYISYPMREKDAVPDDVKRAAREMGRRAFKQR